MKKCTAYLLVLAFAVLYLASGISAQTVQGVVTGTVTDPSGASVPGATVTLTNAGTGVSQSTTTESDGSYRFNLVPPGNYTLDVKASSFAEFKASGVVVQASQTVPLPVKLELAKGKEIIEVTEQVPLVQTATSDLATQVDHATIVNAPLADRDVFSTLPFLAPTVTPGLDMSPTAGGARESGTSYMLNGGDDNDNFSEGAINIHPPLESVQDFSIKTNIMTAEYGRGVGAVVSANQVSGANKFHGAVYEFNRNASLNAEDFFSNREGLPKPKYIRNQAGGIVDGPIVRDKTFFAFAYDWFKIQQGSAAANTFVPTTAGLANVVAKANGNGVNTTSLAKAILSALPPVTSDQPCPNLPNTGAGTEANGLPNPVGCLSFFDPTTDTNSIYYGRVDHNFSQKDRVSVTANIFRESFVDKFGGGPLVTNGLTNATTTNHYHQISVSETHTFSPRLFNEFTLSHNRHFNVFIEGDGKTTVPNIVVDNRDVGGLGYDLGGPFEGGQIQGFVQDRWGFTDGLTYAVGHHTFKFGGGNQYGILYRNWDLGAPGQYEFGNLDALTPSGNPNCAAGTQLTPVCDGTLQADGTITGVNSPPVTSNFTNDYPYFEETSIDPSTGGKASAYRHYTYHDWYWFVQDDWKLSSRLTLNLGVRWDRYGAPGEARGVLAQLINTGCDILTRACLRSLRVGPTSRMWPTRNRDYAPRVGFAWDPTGKGKMAVRGGYGIFYDRIFDNIWSNGAWNPPFYALIDFDASCSDSVFYSNPATVGGSYDPTRPFPRPGHRVSTRLMDTAMKDSSGQNYYLGVERQFAGSFLFRVNYQGLLGRHLPMLQNLNRTDGQAYNAGFANIRPNRLYRGFNYRSNNVTSSYNALVAEVQKRMSQGLEFQTSYTFSKLLDVNSELFAGCSTIGGFTAPYYYVSNAQPNMYRGPGSYDHRHSYKVSVTYELPFLKSEKGIAGRLLGGWSLGSFYQYYFGHPIDVINGNSRYAGSGLDANGIPENLGGDYNLDGVANDHPDFIGSSVGAFYSGKNPADGFFADNNPIGCGFSGATSPNGFGVSPSSTVSGTIADCNVGNGVTPVLDGSGNITGFVTNKFFANPAYPGSGPLYERFGKLGRGVFHGPGFSQLDFGLSKTFKLTETWNLQFRANGQNILNHPNFDCVQGDLSSAKFGKAQCLVGTNTRIMSIGLRLAF